jgi:Zn-dependent protease/cell wall assembly regulator SMI1
MIDLVALAFAVFLLLQLQRVRALLSFVFGPQRMRRIAVPRLPEAFVDLHAQAETELRALGFDEPLWYLLDSPDGSVIAQPVAAWRQREHGDVLWLFALPAPTFANRLLGVFARRLADGRHCLSETFDCYAEITANEQVLAQTIGGADLAVQWQQHREFCARHGETDRTGTDDAAVDWYAASLHEQRLASLVERREVYRDSKGLLRPTLGFAWRMYRAMWRQPRPPVSKEPVPPARLAWLAQVAQRETLRPVPRRVQAGLFAFSVALFLAVGGWFWGVRFAAILFVVVAIHEFGHYLAMRLSGYRNVQMLALPLIGGVTIGHEAKPDAARRAWMSLMGPLPGIVIGWGLLAASLSGGMDFDSLAFQAALVFLFVNYLNVLPVPPLDGAHVVQELLPVGSARLSAVFIAVASVVGALIAYWFGFTLLVFIALLQLSLVRTRWQLGAVQRVLRGDPQMHASQPAMLRQRRVFEVFDRVVGVTAQAPTRLALGAEAMRSIDVRPMRRWQRVFVGGTYAVLLAGPLLAGAVFVGGWLVAARMSVDADASLEQFRQARTRLVGDAAKLGPVELVRGIAESEAAFGNAPAPAVAAPADEAAIAATQARLGVALTDDLKAFYRAVDGVASLSVRPIAALQRVADVADIDLASHAYEGQIAFFRDVVAASSSQADEYDVKLAPDQLKQFLLLGRGDEGILLYDVAEPPAQAGLRLYRIDSDGDDAAAAGLVAWLRSRWIEAASASASMRRRNEIREREIVALAGWSTSQLLGEFEPPSFWLRLISPELAWRGPADEADIAGIAARFGAPLPDDLAELYRRHDGMSTLALLPLSRWQSVPMLPADAKTLLREQHGAVFPDADIASIADCIAIGGHSVDSAGGDDAGRGSLRYVSLLWCPQAPGERRYVDLRRNRNWASHVELLRAEVAEARASRQSRSG